MDFKCAIFLLLLYVSLQKLLDFDYGESDDEEDRKPVQQNLTGFVYFLFVYYAPFKEERVYCFAHVGPS